MSQKDAIQWCCHRVTEWPIDGDDIAGYGANMKNNCFASWKGQNLKVWFYNQHNESHLNWGVTEPKLLPETAPECILSDGDVFRIIYNGKENTLTISLIYLDKKDECGENIVQLLGKWDTTTSLSKEFIPIFGCSGGGKMTMRGRFLESSACV